MHSTNFIFTRTLFLIASCQILENDAILINHELFFHEKRFSQLYHSQFLEINFLISEIILNQFSKLKFL